MDYPSSMPRALTTIAVATALVLGLVVGFFAPFRELREVTVTETLTITHTVAGGDMRTITVTSLTTVEKILTTTETVEVTREVRNPPLMLDLSHARLFEVVFQDGYKVVKDANNRTLLLIPRGAAPPAGVGGIVVQVPVERVVLLSSTQAALLVRLMEYRPEIIDTIAGIAWGGEYEWYLEDIKEALEENRIRDVGAAWQPDFEAILALNPDVMFIYTFPGSTLPAKLDEVGVVYAVDNEWLENTALGRFEWIRFLATFYNMDYEAWLIFREVEGRISEIISKIRAADQPPPKVAWFSIFKGKVYVSRGESYVANALYDLGADYIFKDIKGTGSITVTLEELVTRVIDADVIIYSSTRIESKEDILKEAPELADSKAFIEDRVYIFAPPYWQLGLAYTDEWYLDLAAILYPELFKGHNPTLFRKL